MVPNRQAEKNKQVVCSSPFSLHDLDIIAGNESLAGNNGDIQLWLAHVTLIFQIEQRWKKVDWLCIERR